MLLLSLTTALPFREFANTIILNKTDSVNKDTRRRIRGLVKRLNPSAHVVEAKFGNIAIKEVIDTKNFSFEKAATGMGWLQSLHDLSRREVNGKIKVTPKPETEEYCSLHVHSCGFSERH